VGVVWEQKPVRVNLPFHGLFDVNFLELPNAKAVARWLERLLTWEIVRQTGRTKGTGYFIDPVVLRTLEFPSQTTLTRIEPQRLRELILEDLRRHPGSAYGEIQARIGREIPVNQVRWQLKSLVDAGKLRFEGEKRWRKYSIL
jgi:ATP-dependent DNA helicase RecG